ncbi:40S ribosomal protein S6 [Hibiscus syriacus]|uniref:40S ribosomal protein S6 n=1 Tax=Hibiscus syriacus TaxID=106335 RepID=A0A6A3CSS8_HIBSY|nr:40S ribosomal protein S6 [Hibiscus syriacus]
MENASSPKPTPPKSKRKHPKSSKEDQLARFKGINTLSRLFNLMISRKKMSCFPCFNPRSKYSRIDIDNGSRTTSRHSADSSVSYTTRRKAILEEHKKGSDQGHGSKGNGAHSFIFRELATTTRNFRETNLLGEGGFRRYVAFFDKRISQEVAGDTLGEEFKGYVFKIMGGCDKQGFPMKRKSVRGCIVSQDLSVLNLVIVKKGENDLPGLTDTEKPRMRCPKRASKIRKLFNISKEDDVRKYVNTYRRTFTTKSGKKVSKALKIQRLVTPLTLQRKRSRIADKKKRITKEKSEAAEYQKLVSTRLKEQRERRSESLAKRRSKLSTASKPSVVS